MLTDLSLLSSPPGQLARHPHSGANYYEGADIIAHLTRCLGPAGWSWTTGEHGYDEMADQVWVRGTLTIRIVVEAQDGSEATIETSHVERGWQTANRRVRDQTFVDLGNDYKAADTDALKRAARLVGVGLDAWSKASPRQHQQPPAPARPAPRPAAEPSPARALSPAARADAASRYVDLLARAQAAGFTASWTGSDPARWSDVQLGKYTALLDQYLTRQAGAA
jgi:hypothetical protein